LLQQNVKQLLKALKDHSSYQIPSSVIGNMTIVNKIADIITKITREIEITGIILYTKAVTMHST